MLILRLTLGIILILLGIAGSVLPVLQGWVFFLLAFLVLFPKTRPAEKVLSKIESRMPRLAGWLRRRGIGLRDQSSSDAMPQ